MKYACTRQTERSSAHLVAKRFLALLVAPFVLVAIGAFPSVGQSASLTNASVLSSNPRPSFLGSLSTGNTVGSSQVEISTTPGGLPSISAQQLQEGDTLSIGEAAGFLVRDEFTDTLAAGSVNGTSAVPGPGGRAASTSNVLIQNGYIQTTGTGVWGDAGWYHTPAITRATGLGLYQRVKFVSPSIPLVMFGWRSDQTFTFNGFTDLGWTTAAGNGLAVRYNSAVTSPTVATLTTNTDYDLMSVLRSTGRLMLAKLAGVWTMLWVDSTSSTATLYTGYAANSAGVAGQVDSHRVIQLPAPFNSDYGLATDYKPGNVTVGTTFTHEADFVAEYINTTISPTSGYVPFRFRIQDSTNYWAIIQTSTGSVSLWEVVNGVNTTRAAVSNVLINGGRIVVIAEGTTIRMYQNNVLLFTYSSAVNFAAATSGSVLSLNGGAISNLVTWPRTLSGSAAQILNQVSASAPEGSAFDVGGEYTITEVTSDSTFGINSGLASGDADVGDVVVSTQSGTLTARFTTANAVQNGKFRVLVPARSDAALAADGMPDGGYYDAGSPALSVTCPSNLTGYTFSAGVAVPSGVTLVGGSVYHSFECSYTGNGAIGTVFDGTTNGAIVIDGIINPAPKSDHVAGIADTYRLTIQHLNSSGTVIDSTPVAIGLIDAVRLTASVAPQISFRIEGVQSGVGGLCEAPLTTVSTSSNNVSLGELLIDQFTYAAQYLRVSTNAVNGYGVTVRANDQLGRNGADCTGDPGKSSALDARTLNNSCIPDTTGDGGTMSHTTAAKWSNAQFKGFGYSLDNQNSVSGMTPAFQFNTNSGSCDGSGTCYRQFADGEAGEAAQTLISATAPADNHNVYVCYKAAISNTQAAGDYENFLTFIATATF